jgi:hypothetical protein
MSFEWGSGSTATSRDGYNTKLTFLSGAFGIDDTAFRRSSSSFPVCSASDVIIFGASTLRMLAEVECPRMRGGTFMSAMIVRTYFELRLTVVIAGGLIPHVEYRMFCK